MNNPRRSIFVNHSSHKYLVKLQIDILLDKLIITHSVHNLLKNELAPMIETTLNNDPEANVVENNSVPTKMVFKSEAHLGQVNHDFPNIQTLVNQYNNRRSELIKVDFFGNSFWFTFDNLYLLYNFLNSFLRNYDVIKYKILNPKPIVAVEQSIIKEVPQKSILEEVLNLSPNPIVNYYIIKWVKNNKIHCNFKDTVLKINHPFDFDFLLFSEDNAELINQFLQFVDINNRDENIFKTKALVRYLNSSLKDDNEISNNEKYVQIQVTLFLIFLYGCRTFYPNLDVTQTSNFEKGYVVVINKCISSIVKDIKVELESSDTDDVVNFKELSEKYKYLIKIDQEAFIDQVFFDAASPPPVIDTETPINIDQKRFLGSPKIIDIKKFIDSQASDELLLSYVSVKENIISKHYNDILDIENGGIKVTSKKIHQIIARWADVIINHIFKKIDKEHINTFEIMSKFIDPFIISDDISEKTKLWILYQILIPHMHNLYGTEKFIDYFHIDITR